MKRCELYAFSAKKIKYIVIQTRLGRYLQSYQSVTSLQQSDSGRSETLDTSKPMEIVEDEELERISALLQRDNLVRGLGIVEHVYRLLHCTPGTMGIQMKNDKYLYPHSVSVCVYIYVYPLYDLDPWWGVDRG